MTQAVTRAARRLNLSSTGADGPPSASNVGAIVPAGQGSVLVGVKRPLPSSLAPTPARDQGVGALVADLAASLATDQQDEMARMLDKAVSSVVLVSLAAAAGRADVDES